MKKKKTMMEKNGDTSSERKTGNPLGPKDKSTNNFINAEIDEILKDLFT